MDGNNYLLKGVFLVLFAGNLFAQYDEPYLSHIRCNYCLGLSSENAGVVTACLINVMRLYHHYPLEDYTTIYNQLDTLSNQGATEEIRFMAKIIKDYFDHKYKLDWLMDYSFEEIYLYFKMLSRSDIRKITYEY